MSSPTTTNIESVLHEERVFAPAASFSGEAHIKSLEDYERLRADASATPDAFWARMAEELHWFKKWDTVLKWDAPHAQWFTGGKTNISYNCLDRHLGTWRRNKAAIIWEGEPGDRRTLTYKYGASDVAFLDRRPNNLLFAEAIGYGVEHGFERLDFGRTDYDNPGLRTFKLGWGATEHQLAYTYLGAPGREGTDERVPSHGGGRAGRA